MKNEQVRRITESLLMPNATSSEIWDALSKPILVAPAIRAAAEHIADLESRLEISRHVVAELQSVKAFPAPLATYGYNLTPSTSDFAPVPFGSFDDFSAFPSPEDFFSEISLFLGFPDIGVDDVVFQTGSSRLPPCPTYGD